MDRSCGWSGDAFESERDWFCGRCVRFAVSDELELACVGASCRMVLSRWGINGRLGVPAELGRLWSWAEGHRERRPLCASTRELGARETQCHRHFQNLLGGIRADQRVLFCG